MAPIVDAENLGKHYTLGGLDPGYATLRESLAGLIGGGRDGAHRPLESPQSFWALRDVSFKMDAGETLGIVGRNGAGKSTLLKILCRITKPTTGRARLEGRVGSLLEVGTGFHPDLTGRENIYLNGAILGMRRSEIRAKFDEIVDFSEVERHLDTPVKFYSSGMYVRLAFSVAAHLDTEILIMDEVLAVGDAAFQQKCLDKMHRIRGEGRTIFFVSHNMAAVTRLCRRALYLRDGRVVKDGAAAAVVAAYMQESSQVRAVREWEHAASAPGDEIVRLRSVRVCDGASRTLDEADAREDIGIAVAYNVFRGDYPLVLRIDVYNDDGIHLFGGEHVDDQAHAAGLREHTAWVPGDIFAPGNLSAHVSLRSPADSRRTHVEERNAVGFRVVDGTRAATEVAADGVIRPVLRWTAGTAKAQQNGETAAR